MSYVDPIQQKNLIRAAVKEAVDPLIEQLARMEKKIDDLKKSNSKDK